LPDVNSKRTRVDPVFGWLKAFSETDSNWPAQLLALVHGLEADIQSGTVVDVAFEHPVHASQERLQWLIDNASQLGHEGEKLTEIARRADSGHPRLSVLEGTTYADCLIGCENAIIWVEGKRTDWLSPGTTWDPVRDQLARNLEAAWITALKREKADFCVLLCHEADLNPDEQDLVNDYRSGELIGGLQHLDDESRREFSKRIGTVTWREIVKTWPELRADPRLADV
jgi:hypothetical protein